MNKINEEKSVSKYDWIKKRLKTPASIAVYASLTSILVGILFGFVLMLILNPGDSFYGFIQLLTSGLSSSRKMSDILYNAAPLIMTGLAVGFAFKTGLFNIGAAGQYLMGGFFALYSAFMFGFPWWLALIASAIGGAIWGSIPGLFKALLNVNEVITSIMFNWIGLYTCNLIIANTPKMLANYYGAITSDRTADLGLANPNAVLPKLGLDKIFSQNMSIAIFIAIIIAIGIHYLLNRTTFGYELKAVGHNRHASKYAGINEKRNIISAMAISGALAGIGGGFYYLTGVAQFVILDKLGVMGFNGIPVALLASSDPIGIIFSAFFVAYTQVGGNAMQPEFAKEIADIIISVIIYLSAFALLFRGIIARRIKRKNEENENASDNQVISEKEESN